MSITVLSAHSAYASIKTMVIAVGLLLGLSAFGHCNQGCKPAQDSLDDPAHNYATEIIACAATAGYPGAYSYDSDMRCRDDVDRRYGVGRFRPDAGK